MQEIVTIKDIAQHLKLSISTVSRALRGCADIKKETKLQVLELAKQLNYTPNPIALSLREKRSRIIGVIVPEIANNFCSATIAGIEDIAYSRGYHVVTFQSHEKYEREVINTQLIASRRVDGLIISLSNETSKYDHLEQLIEKGIPVVMFDRISNELKTPKVVVNDYLGSYQATEHFIKEGFTKIAHITISKFMSITQNRLNGYKDALKKYNIPLRDEWIVHCNFTSSDIDNHIRKLFKRKDRPHAILASVERLAIRCLYVLKEMNLKIPDDVALISFSDNPLNSFLTPSLTCVRQPTFDIGQKSAELLIDMIENKTSVKNNKTVELETTLEIHASSQGLVMQES